MDKPFSQANSAPPYGYGFEGGSLAAVFSNQPIDGGFRKSMEALWGEPMVATVAAVGKVALVGLQVVLKTGARAGSATASAGARAFNTVAQLVRGPSESTGRHSVPPLTSTMTAETVTIPVVPAGYTGSTVPMPLVPRHS